MFSCFCCIIIIIKKKTLIKNFGHGQDVEKTSEMGNVYVQAKWNLWCCKQNCLTNMCGTEHKIIYILKLITLSLWILKKLDFTVAALCC